MQNKKNNKDKRKLFMIVLLVFVIASFVVGITYAFYQISIKSSQINTLKTPKLVMSYTETSDELTVSKYFDDNKGKTQEDYFEFDISATTAQVLDLEYSVFITESQGNQYNDEYIKLYLTKVVDNVETMAVSPVSVKDLSVTSFSSNSKLLYSDKLVFTSSDETTLSEKYRLRVWISNDAINMANNGNISIGDVSYKFKVDVSTGKYSEEVPAQLLTDAIMNQGVVDSGDGLYSSTATTNGQPTYYYKGMVDNNYVVFAKKTICNYNGVELSNGLDDEVLFTATECNNVISLCDFDDRLNPTYSTPQSEDANFRCSGGYEFLARPEYSEIDIVWRVVRINEDGTIRLISHNVDLYSRLFNSNTDQYKYMYYSESNIVGGAMYTLNQWYNKVLKKYDSAIATSTFCEALKAMHTYGIEDGAVHDNGNATPVIESEFVPDFTCTTDGNGYGLLANQKIGMITMEEMLMAGNSLIDDGTFTFINGYAGVTMSPAGFIKNIYNDEYVPHLWSFPLSFPSSNRTDNALIAAAVINLKPDVLVSGNGTADDPWRVVLD